MVLAIPGGKASSVSYKRYYEASVIRGRGYASLNLCIEFCRTSDG
jgi:hypothetical protein